MYENNAIGKVLKIPEKSHYFEWLHIWSKVPNYPKKGNKKTISVIYRIIKAPNKYKYLTVENCLYKLIGKHMHSYNVIAL